MTPKGLHINVREQNPNWTGDAVSYAGLHKRLKRARGKASEHLCTDCGGPAAQWSYDKSDPNPRIEVGGKADGFEYSLDFDRYQPRCHKCHRDADGGSFGKRDAHPRCKLKASDIEDIKVLRSQGESLYAIARRYDVNATAIWKVLNR